MVRLLLPLTLTLGLTAAMAEDRPTTKAIGPNRAANGSFEEGPWSFEAVNGCQATGEVTKEQAHSGAQSFKLGNKSAFAPNVYGRAFQVISGLEPFTTYRLSCYVKGKNVGIAWIGGGPGWYHRQRFPEGTYDWKYIETLWTTDSAAHDYELIIATESPTEAVWIDDVKFEPVRVDAARHDALMGKFNQAIVTQQKRLAEVTSKIARLPGAEAEPIIQLGVHVARRYLDRVTALPPAQSMVWSTLQIEEVEAVLTETEKQIEHFRANEGPRRPIQFPLGGPVAIRDGLFYTETSAGQERPWFFYGMGHFGEVMKDLPAWREMGATLVQDGRCGPSSMEKDGTLSEGARLLLADLARADRYGIKVDFLLSPHYFPAWAWNPATSAGLREGGGLGFLNFNIDHPAAKEAVGRWCAVMAAALKEKPALLSICLSNEPVYDKSGRTRETLPLYREYLRQIHGGAISRLNALYGTNYKDFDDVSPPGHGLVQDVEKNRAFYDWTRFNKKHFSDWHRWMAEILKKDLPQIPVHAKIMVFYSLDRDKLSWGVDPEEFCDLSDVAGCDAYALPSADFKSYDWFGHEFWYDLLNSFHDQPVFNSENHIIADGTGPLHIPRTMTRAQFWQDAIHHQGATTTWVWERAIDTSLLGSIYYRPANTYGAGRAFIDIDRFAGEVAAINLARPRVALLYSQPSIFWEGKYAAAIRDIYTRLNFLGEKVTFVSEKMLHERRLPAHVEWIVLPQATHVEDATLSALADFVSGGGKLVCIGEDNLTMDQYHRKRNVPRGLGLGPAVTKLDFTRDSAGSQQGLRNLLKPIELLDAASGKPAWNVEYRLVERGGAALVPIINFAVEPVTVKCPAIAGKRVIDLLSGEEVNPMSIKLEPITPRLLRAQ
jgi:hypothetical protein